MNDGFEHIFPSLRGVQAGREYYISMCPMRLVPKIFLFNEQELAPELRAQRILNKQRVPMIARYLLENIKSYTLSSLTASIDGEVRFEPFNEDASDMNIGRLHVPMESRIVINDGQHRRAAIEMALRDNPDLGDESISVVFFIDVGLKRSQQMFADLNRYAIRPTTSLGLLYDHRNENALVAKAVMERVPVFDGLTEMERSSISNRSIKLFTLSGINNATQALLSGLSFETFQDKLKLAVAFWRAVSKQIPDWQLAKEGKVSPGDLRRDMIHAHALALAALARVGNTIQIRYGAVWEKRLGGLDTIDWSRANPKWEGRALNAGRLSKRSINIKLTANLIKKHLRIPLSEEEKKLESDLKR